MPLDEAEQRPGSALVTCSEPCSLRIGVRCFCFLPEDCGQRRPQRDRKCVESGMGAALGHVQICREHRYGNRPSWLLQALSPTLSGVQVAPWEPGPPTDRSPQVQGKAGTHEATVRSGVL